jgi:AcrR family transcriptional regulator
MRIARFSQEEPMSGTAPAAEPAEGSWQERALERSLRAARAKAISRSDKFIAVAMELLQETGSTDFTVQELADRARTSLRTFYQYFSSKDELMLALLEVSVRASVQQWREDVREKDALAALEHVMGKIYGADARDRWASVNRALASYHVTLAEAHGEAYRRGLEPLTGLVRELIDRGVAEGVVRADVPVDQLLRVVIQSVMGATLINVLGVKDHDRSADMDVLWEFWLRGLTAR